MNDPTSEAPPEQPKVEIIKWYVAPINIPEEVKTGIEDAAKERRIPLTEFVLVAAMAAAGYDPESIKQTRFLAYPPGRRES